MIPTRNEKSNRRIHRDNGVGFLVSLGLFFLTDSQVGYWGHIEYLAGTNSWGILASVPILIVNYIMGLIVIEIAEVAYLNLIYRRLQVEFQNSFKNIAQLNNEFVSARYTEVYQNKRILNGSSIGFMVISMGVFLEAVKLGGSMQLVGMIGMLGSLSLAIICPVISLRIQSEFNQLLKSFQEQVRESKPQSVETYV